jgi:transmembrane sensor
MMRWPFVGRRERLRREASDWVARLNGASGPADRAAFEQWYRAAPDHAAAYDRLSGLFAAAGQIRRVPTPATGERGGTSVWPRHGLAALVAIGAVVVLSLPVLGGRDAALPERLSVQATVVAASPSESRLIALADGSEILLSPGSELDVRIDGERRRLQLTRGEARFTVFHEARPFIVSAQGAEVVARGTQFVVSLTPDGMLVSLIEGRVEVAYAASSAAGARTVASLGPGERLVVPPPTEPTSASPATGRLDPAMIEFDNTPLAEAVELVNRGTASRVRLADPALGALRVTGAFRTGDGMGFARGVAAALSLEVERASDGALLLGERPGQGG